MPHAPDPILAAIHRGPETGAVLGALQTRGEHVFVAEDGRFWRAPIWWVVTERHTWLAAAVAEHAWAIGCGDAREVTFDEGWTQRRLGVGRWSVALPRSSRKEARALYALWQQTRWGGQPWPPEQPTSSERAQAAEGAVNVPTWVPNLVPGEADERWLCATTTASQQPFNLKDGTIEHTSLWLLVSDRRAVLAARNSDGGVHVQDVPTPILREARAGASSRYRAATRTFSGPALRDAPLASAVAVANAGPAPERWALLASQALQDALPERALALWREARSRQHDDAQWQDVALLCLAAGQGGLAAQALAHHLTRQEEDAGEGARAWISELAGVRKAAKRVDQQALEALVDLAAPARPADLPWPPGSPTETWLTALVLTGALQQARLLLASLDQSARSYAYRAAVLDAMAEEDGAQSWLSAALAARGAEEHASARAYLDKSLEVRDTGPSRWLAGAWAWQDEQDATPHWVRALALQPEGATAYPLQVDGERALARVAQEELAWRPAIDAWQRAIALAPAYAAPYQEAARVLEQHCDAPGEAADVLERAATALDEGELKLEAARWTLWIEIARLRKRAGQPAPCTAALLQALEGDFLRPEAYEAALALDPPPALADWWRHLLRLLAGAGAAEGKPMAPRATLDEATLDALHPGGRGWLAELRDTLELPEVPDRQELVRGLERLRTSEHPGTAALFAALSERLGMLAPPPTYLYRGEGAWGVSAWPLDPPVVLLGHDHLGDGERHLAEAGLAFLAAVELTHLRCGHPLLAFQQDLVGTSRSVYAHFGRYAGTAETLFDVVTLIPGVDQVGKVQNLVRLSRRFFAARGALDKVTGLAGTVVDKLRKASSEGGVAREQLTGAALQFRIQADRAALLLTGDARAAVDAMLRASSRSLALAGPLQEQGLASLLAREDGPTRDEALRITLLLDFAASRRPDLEPG